MTRPQNGRMSETLTNVYLERFCSEADRVYRLAFAALLDNSAAQKIVEKVFRSIADELARLSADSDADLLLLGRCWEMLKGSKSTQKITSGGSILDSLFAMPLESRVAVAAVDVLGLSREEMHEVFHWSESDWRKHLALGRKTLLTGSGAKIELPPEETAVDETP